MRSATTLDTLTGERFSTRKRVRLASTRSHWPESSQDQGRQEGKAILGSRKALLVIESEGTVFDSLALRHEKAYLPAFVGCFSLGLDPAKAALLWRKLSLFSRLRGQEPLVILQAALRILNRNYPSVRRTAVLRALESFLSSPGSDPLALAEAGEAAPERLLLDWLSMAEALMEEEGYAPCFHEAQNFLKNLNLCAPGVDLLVHSSFSESLALNEWEMAGLGGSFMRIAGAERGGFASYLRSALKNGYEAVPILIIGTSGKAWQAAQSVGARFYPIMPDTEEEGWRHLAQEYFPAFLRGEGYLQGTGANFFMSMMIEDLDSSLSI